MAAAAAIAMILPALMAPSCPGSNRNFSHKNHVTDQGLECKDCHEGGGDGAKAGAPNLEVCATCHEDADKYTASAKKAIEDWPSLKALPADGKFSHANHAKADVACKACHGAVEKSNRISTSNMPTERICLDCHETKGSPTDCATCHSQLKKDTAPPDHKDAWEIMHGKASEDMVRGGRCYRCHPRSDCLSCHENKKPSNHTVSWRNMGHGLQSQIDRNNCQTCHRTDFCIACHKQSTPRSHVGNWGDRHCFGCHVTSGGDIQSCNVCHTSGVLHTTAPRKPEGVPHDAATDCRSCHNGPFLRHPDNGDNCRYCHK